MKDYKRHQIKISNRYEIFNCSISVCIKKIKKDKEDSLDNYLHLDPLTYRDIYKFISTDGRTIIYNS